MSQIPRSDIRVETSFEELRDPIRRHAENFRLVSLDCSLVLPIGYPAKIETDEVMLTAAMH